MPIWKPFLLCILLLTSPFLYASDQALLIGISQYQEPSLNLAGPDNDLKDMKEFVETYWGFNNVTTLLNEQATYTAILKALDDLVKKSKKNDRIFIYYAGHGHFMADKAPYDENDRLDEALVAYDTQRIQGETNPATAFKNLVSDDEIKQRLDKLKEQRVFILVDSCHSGTMHRGIMSAVNTKAASMVRSPQLAFAKMMTRSIAEQKQQQRNNSLIEKRDNLIFISAVAANQYAMTDGTKYPRRGVFTQAFVQGLQDKKADKNHDQQVSFSELFDYLRQRSQTFYLQNKNSCRSPLTPTWHIAQQVQEQDVHDFMPKIAYEFSLPPLKAADVENILVHDNLAKLTVRIINTQTKKSSLSFHLGDSVQFQVESDKAGYLFLFDINSQGEMTRLFPNEKHHVYLKDKENWVAANGIIKIPDVYYNFEFKARKPIGKSRLLVVLSEDPLPMADLKSVYSPTQAKNALLALREHLNKIFHHEDGSNREIRWSVTWLDYEIKN